MSHPIEFEALFCLYLKHQNPYKHWSICSLVEFSNEYFYFKYKCNFNRFHNRRNIGSFIQSKSAEKHKSLFSIFFISTHRMNEKSHSNSFNYHLTPLKKYRSQFFSVSLESPCFIIVFKKVLYFFPQILREIICWTP